MQLVITEDPEAVYHLKLIMKNGKDVVAPTLELNGLINLINYLHSEDESPSYEPLNRTTMFDTHTNTYQLMKRIEKLSPGSLRNLLEEEKENIKKSSGGSVTVLREEKTHNDMCDRLEVAADPQGLYHLTIIMKSGNHVAANNLELDSLIKIFVHLHEEGASNESGFLKP
ncbi:hypothetical protein [Jeotgalibacillus marinus]|uniref:Uncharacterized protein n=1 Tax=Jeotgalibacillus marinus TaxID=86667 RepID=A0ABV3Q683_9BACL